MKHYMDYLPNYLGGRNIEAHASLMDSLDLDVNNLLQLLSLWSRLDRPILIERVATSLLNLTMKVHINVPSSIRKVTIKGDYTYTGEFLESEAKVEHLVSFSIQGSTDTIVNPDFTVTVETYDEVTYTKAYPENDISVGTVYDHDEFLDRIGTLAGIPRRQYIPYSLSDGYKAEPRYFGKTVTKTVTNDIVQSCTEDDYYYYKRIKYYMENFNKKSLPVLLLETVYGYSEVTELNTATINDESSMWDHIRESETYIEEANKAGTYIFLVNKSNPVNIGSLSEEDKVLFVEKYIPVTRVAYIFAQLVTSVDISDFVYPRSYSHRFAATVLDEYYHPVVNRDFVWTVDGVDPFSHTRSDTDGVGTVVFNDIPLGYHTLNVEHVSGGGYEGSLDSEMYKSYLDEMQEDVEFVFTVGMMSYPVYPVYPWSNSKDFLYCMRCSGEDGYHVLVEHPTGEGGMTAYRTSTLLEGEHLVWVIPSSDTVLVDGEIVETTPVLEGIAQRKGVQVSLVGVEAGDSVSVQSWVTDYQPYNFDDVNLDEFTLRYHVDIPVGVSSYPAVLVCDGRKFIVDLLAVGGVTGRNTLEYKFINYDCRLYLNDMDTDYNADWDVYTVDNGVTPVDMPFITGGEVTEYSYNHNPVLMLPDGHGDLVLYEDEGQYMLPITNRLDTPQHLGEIPSHVEIYISQEYDDYTVLEFMNMDGTMSSFPFHVTLWDDKGLGLTAPVSLRVEGYPETLSITLDIVDGTMPDMRLTALDHGGTMTLTAEYEGGWKRGDASHSVEFPIRRNPTFITCEFRNQFGGTELYTHSSYTMDVNIHVEAEHIGYWIEQIPQRFVREQEVTIQIEDKEYTVTTDNNGDATLTIPVGTRRDTTYNVQIRYAGDDVYEPCTLDTQYYVAWNQDHITALSTPFQRANAPYSLQFQVLDSYNTPVNKTVYGYLYGTGASISTAQQQTPDDEGIVTFDFPAIIVEEGETRNQTHTIATTSSLTSRYDKLNMICIFITEPLTPTIAVKSSTDYLTNSENVLDTTITYGGQAVNEGYVQARINDTYLRNENGAIITVDLSESSGAARFPFTVARYQPLGPVTISVEYSPTLDSELFLPRTKTLEATVSQNSFNEVDYRKTSNVILPFAPIVGAEIQRVFTTDRVRFQHIFVPFVIPAFDVPFYEHDIFTHDSLVEVYPDDPESPRLAYEFIYYFHDSNTYISSENNPYWRYDMNTSMIPIDWAATYGYETAQGTYTWTRLDTQRTSSKYFARAADHLQSSIPLTGDVTLFVRQEDNECVVTTLEEWYQVSLDMDLVSNVMTTSDYRNSVVNCRMILLHYSAEISSGEYLTQQDITIRAFNENGDSVLVDTVTTGGNGVANATIQLSDISLSGENITLLATYTDPTSSDVLASANYTIHIEDSVPQTAITLTKVGSITAANRLPYTTYTVEAELVDLSTSTTLAGEDITFTLPSGATQTVQTNSNGVASVTFQPSTADMDSNNRLNVRADYAGKTIDDTPVYSASTKSTYWTVTEDEPITTQLTCTVITDTSQVTASNLPNTPLSARVQLHTNDGGLPSQHNLAQATVGLYYWDGVNETFIRNVTTGSNGAIVTTGIRGLICGTSTTLELRAKYNPSGTTYTSSSASAVFTVIEDRIKNTSISLSKTTPTTAANRLPFVQYSVTALLQDDTSNPVVNESLLFTLPSGATQNITTDSTGRATATFTPSENDMDVNNRLNVQVQYAGHGWDGSSDYNPSSQSTYWTVTADEPFITALDLQTSYVGDTIPVGDLPTVQIPITVHLETNDPIFPNQYSLIQQSIGVYAWDGTTETLLTTLTTDSNGTSTTTLNGLPTTTNTTISIVAKYLGQGTEYLASTDDITFNVTQPTPQYTDPLADSLLFDISNWGTYASGSSGSSQTGTLTAATSSDLTIDATNKTLTDKNQKYFVYNKTLQDFFNYYGDTFSLIAYKTGGDGRYQLGFVNTTTGGYKLGYVDGSAVNNEASSSTSLGEVVYQKYNEITFERDGTNITLYWKQGGTTYKSKTMPLGTVDPTKYYLYWRSTVRSGFTFTNDTSKIENHSRP